MASKTILEGGLNYALVNRFSKALSKEWLDELNNSEFVELIDGKGVKHSVSQKVIEASLSIGVKILASSTSSSLRRRLEKRGDIFIFNEKEVKLGRPKRKR